MNARKRLLLLCLFFAFTYCSFAQTKTIDSLKKVISKEPENTKKLELLLALCDKTESLPYDTIAAYAKQAKTLAVTSKNADAQAFANYYIFLAATRKNNADSNLAYCTRQLQTLSYKSNKRLFVKYSLSKARLLIKQAQFKDALELSYALLATADDNDDNTTKVRALTFIGWIKMEMQQPAEAINWFRKAYSILGNETASVDFSPLYSNMAAVFDELIQKDSSLFYIKLAIKSSQQHESLTYVANAFAIQADIYMHTKKTKEAEAALSQAIAIRKQIGDAFYIVSDMAELAMLYASVGEPDNGIALSKEAIAIAEQNNFTSKKLYLYQALADNYKAAANYQQYAQILENIISVRDSMYQQNSAQALAELQAKYETEKQENTIIAQRYALTKKNYFIYGIITLFSIIIALTLTIFFIRRQQQILRIKDLAMANERAYLQGVEKAKEEERKRILADLHDDMGGGLSSIRIVSDLMLQQHHQLQEVNSYAQKISSITTDVTQRMNTIVWALNTENNTLQNLCEYIRQYGYSFFEFHTTKFHSVIPDYAANVQLSGLQRKNIFLCVKEALNNVVKHAKARNVWVNILFENSVLEITIKDDGEQAINANAFGNGLKNMQNRMKEINGIVSFVKENCFTIVLEILVV